VRLADQWQSVADRGGIPNTHRNTAFVPRIGEISPMVAKAWRVSDDASDATVSFEMILRACEPLLPADRDPFLRALAHRLSGEPELGDGVVGRAIREL